MQNLRRRGTVLGNIAVGLDQVPQFGLDQCFGVGLGMVSLSLWYRYTYVSRKNCSDHSPGWGLEGSRNNRLK